MICDYHKSIHVASNRRSTSSERIRSVRIVFGEAFERISLRNVCVFNFVIRRPVQYGNNGIGIERFSVNGIFQAAALFRSFTCDNLLRFPVILIVRFDIGRLRTKIVIKRVIQIRTPIHFGNALVLKNGLSDKIDHEQRTRRIGDQYSGQCLQ